MKIAIVYTKDPLKKASTMDIIRWISLSTALSKLGLTVDMVTASGSTSLSLNNRLRVLPISSARWDEYDIIKVCYQRTFDFVPYHPRTIVRLARVAGPDDTYRDDMHIDELLSSQIKIAATAKAIIVNDEINRERWIKFYGTGQPIYILPTGCPSVIPMQTNSPFKSDIMTAVFTGSLSSLHMIEMLNEIGHLLKHRGWKLIVAGPNKTAYYCSQKHNLDKRFCKYIGTIGYEDIFSYISYARVGLALAPGPLIHENETSKIYYYLRCGLPVACEEYISNANLLTDLHWGKIFKYNSPQSAVDCIVSLEDLHSDLSTKKIVVQHMKDNHTWECRASSLMNIFDEVYERKA